MVEIARELELEVGSENVTESLQFHDKILTKEELLLMDEQLNWFFEMEPTSDEDAMKVAEMSTQNLECYLIDTAMVGFESFDSNWKIVYCG